MINFILIFAAVAYLSNTLESLYEDNVERASRFSGKLERVKQFIRNTFFVSEFIWIRSIILGLTAGLALVIPWDILAMLLYISIAVYVVVRSVTKTTRLEEAVIASLIPISLFSGFMARQFHLLANMNNGFVDAIVTTSSRFALASVVAIIFAVYFAKSLLLKKESVVRRLVGMIVILLCVVSLGFILYSFGARWDMLTRQSISTEDDFDEEPIVIYDGGDSVDESEEEVSEADENPKPAEPLEGPNYGTTDEGVWYDYREYNDREVDDKGKWTSPKSKFNAFGYDYSDLWFEKPTEAQDLAVRKAIAKKADDLPEALAFYSFDFFTKEEKKELGIKDLPVTSTDSKKASIEGNFDKEGGGELQENLKLAFEKELYSDNVRLKFITKTGNQKTAYIFHDDADKDGEVIPNEAICCYDTAKRNNSKQVEVQRYFPYASGKGGEWKTVLILNMDCGFQPCWEKVPRGVPKKPSDPPTPAPTPVPTPKPQPKPNPQPQQPKKDPKDELPTSVNQPNQDKTSVGENTNNGPGATESTAEPNVKEGDAPASTDMTVQEYINNTNEILQESKEQDSRNDSTLTTPTPPNTNVNNDGVIPSAYPTTDIPPLYTGGANGDAIVVPEGGFSAEDFPEPK